MLEFVLTSVGLARNSWLFRDIHFMHPWELEVKDSPKSLDARALNKHFFKNQNIVLYLVFPLNIYRYW